MTFLQRVFSNQPRSTGRVGALELLTCSPLPAKIIGNPQAALRVISARAETSADDFSPFWIHRCAHTASLCCKIGPGNGTHTHHLLLSHPDLLFHLHLHLLHLHLHNIFCCTYMTISEKSTGGAETSTKDFSLLTFRQQNSNNEENQRKTTAKIRQQRQQHLRQQQPNRQKQR